MVLQKQMVISGQNLNISTNDIVDGRGVILNSVIGERGIISRNSSFITQILMCTSSERGQHGLIFCLKLTVSAQPKE